MNSLQIQLELSELLEYKFFPGEKKNTVLEGPYYSFSWGVVFEEISRYSITGFI
jgi:hypothetical protein